ncbi:dipeptidase [Rathayibacter sp. YIM 133350]|uniref:dipeptidase n=1 Tax=Rathayibacter sp. YIM 133350 TaxID=3131992 RepID=UPI00307EFE1C
MTDANSPDLERTDHDREEAVRQAIADGFPATIADLTHLVRIPSVSWPAFDQAHVHDSAAAVAELFRETGVFESVELRQAPVEDGSRLGNPAVLATRAARNGRPTVLLYAHHDVQPPGEDAGWESAPYEPTVRGERLYGRGAADDKAGIMAHVASVRALSEAFGPDFDLGLAVFIEGEEEAGSLSFANFLEQNRDALAADVIIVADSSNWDVQTPALTVTLRGAVAFRLTVRTLDHAVHSGMYGGAVPDAMLALTRLLASFHGADGSVAVAGLTGAESDTPPYDETQLRAETGLLDQVAPIGHGSILSRLWSQPAITVTGIDAPSVGNASNTLLPSVSARVSVRVAPGQTDEEARAVLEAHIAEHIPFGAQYELSEFEMGNPFRVDTGGWAVPAAKQAMADAWGVPAVEAGIGGSIPFIADLVRVFPQAQILVTGVEDPDSRAHSPNESLHLEVFRKSVLAEALLLARVNERDTTASPTSEPGDLAAGER